MTDEKITDRWRFLKFYRLGVRSKRYLHKTSISLQSFKAETSTQAEELRYPRRLDAETGLIIFQQHWRHQQMPSFDLEPLCSGPRFTLSSPEGTSLAR